MDCYLYISYGADKQNLVNNQELFKLVIIYFILLTFTIWRDWYWL